MRIGKRALTDTKTSRQMTFDKEYLDEIGFKAGTYNIIYLKDMVVISKDITKSIINLLQIEEHD